MSKRYRIKNMEGFCHKILSMACRDIGIDESEYKNYININNVEQIVVNNSEELDDDIFVNDEILDVIKDDIQNWVLGVQLSKMCSEGILDCYWDNENNCMTFKVVEREGENG